MGPLIARLVLLPLPVRLERAHTDVLDVDLESLPGFSGERIISQLAQVEDGSAVGEQVARPTLPSAVKRGNRPRQFRQDEGSSFRWAAQIRYVVFVVEPQIVGDGEGLDEPADAGHTRWRHCFRHLVKGLQSQRWEDHVMTGLS